MRHKKIHIIGGPGSGKTYCAKRLSVRLDLTHYDLDNIFWDKTVNKYGIKNSADKRKVELAKILDREEFIIEGVYYDWVAESFANADLIIILNTSVWIRDWRIIKRFLKRKTGLIQSKKETLNALLALLRWNHNYDKRNLKKALELIKKHNNNIVFAKSYEEIVLKLDI